MKLLLMSILFFSFQALANDNTEQIMTELSKIPSLEIAESSLRIILEERADGGTFSKNVVSAE